MHAFVRECLCIGEGNSKPPSRQQVDACNALTLIVRAKLRRSSGVRLSEEEWEAAKKDGLSVQAGRGTGKDAWVSWAISWFLVCFPGAKIPCTAPTQRQLRDILWAEINKWIRHSDLCHEAKGSPFRLSDWVKWQSDRVFFVDAEGREWFAKAITTNVKATPEEQAETLSGWHEDFLMVVADEASAIPDAVFRPLEGTMTGMCNFMILIFNATQSKGFAIESQQRNREHFICLQWNAEDSELVEPSQVEKMAKKYGRDSDAYRISVLGLPPKADPGVLIPWDWIMSCVDLELEPDPLYDQYIISCDVGGTGEGDPSMVMITHGPKVLEIFEHRSVDTEELTHWIMGYIFDYEPVAVLIDSIGIGAGVVDKLSHRTTANIQGVNVAEVQSLREPERFFKLRDELWWRLRTRFEQRTISIPNNDTLIGELSTPKYSPDAGKIKVEGKKELRARGISSPNMADALMIQQYYDQDTYRRLRQPTLRRRAMLGVNWRTA